MKNKKLLLLVLVFVGVFWMFLAPGPRVAGDFPYIFPEVARVGFNLPQVWSFRTAEGLGEYVVSTLWAWPNDLLYGLSAALGMSFAVLERVLGVFPILILGTWSISKLLGRLGIKGWSRWVGTLFYLTNTYILLVIDGGQLIIGLAYSFMPAAFLMVDRSINSGHRQKIFAGLAVSLVGFFDIRFVYVLLLLAGLRFLYGFLFLSRNKWLDWFFSWFKSGVVIGLIMIGLNAYWLIPAIMAKVPALPATYQRTSQATFLSFSTLGHSLSLLQPHWFKNVFGKVTELKLEFALIPVLVFLAPILKKKSKVVGFWLLVALAGVFLVKGANPPFPGVYPWLFTNIPGFSLFRDPTKFFFLVALSYSILIGITADELVKRFNWKLKIINWKIAVVPLILASYFIILARPVWLGRMTGTFAAPVYQDEYFALAEKLENDKDFGRVFWIPTKAPLGFSSSAHPSVEASRLVQKRPFAIGTVGTYEIFNFLREAPFMGELFDIAAIKYVVYPFPDTRREELKQDNIDYYYAFLDQLSNLGWIDKKVSDAPVAALKTTKSQDHFFISENTWVVVGSDRIYWDLVEVEGFKLSSNALVFTEEQPGLGAQIPDYASVILYDKEPIDFAVTFIDKSNFVFPAENLDFSPSTSSGSSGWPASNALRSNAGWWKRETADLISWRNFLQQKYGVDNLDFGYGGGWVVAEGNSRYKILDPRFKKGDVLLARVMTSSRGGKVEFYQGDEKIGAIDTKISDPDTVEVRLTGYGEIEDQAFEYNKADFGWFEVGDLVTSSQMLDIRTNGDINVINALISINPNDWVKLNENLKQHEIIYWEELSNKQKTSLFVSYGDEVELSYQRISPTRYKVKVEGVKKPVTLAFSETYDRLWGLRGQESFPLYSLINGFTVWEDGEYDVYFSAQQYVLPGLYLSGLTVLLIAVLLTRPKKKS